MTDLDTLKQCPVCQAPFAQANGEPPSQFKRRRFCSRVCGSVSANQRRAEDPKVFILKRALISADGCWNWCNAKNSSGYGDVTFRRKKVKAHRLAYEAFKGSIPEDMCVCHTCDNRACVNPDHLFLGSNAENTADRDAKQRQARGEKAGRSLLTEQDVLSIRASSEADTVLATRYGVGSTTINSARRGKSWKHL